MLNFGGKNIGELYYGGRKIGEAYLGDRLVYQSSLPVEVMPNDSSARDWLRGKLVEYGEHYETVENLPFKLDTSQVTIMSQMFRDCSSLTTVPDMDTSKVMDMSHMFRGCSSLTTVPDMDTSKVTRMTYMFLDCESLTDGNVRLLRATTSKPNSRSAMIQGSGLTREPFYLYDGTPF